MSGKSISDHKFWAGGKSAGSVFPMGAKVKMESSAEGAGKLGMYEDTTETIKRDQNAAVSKMKAHPAKPGQRQ